MTLSFTLPLAPSVNHMYFTTRTGQRILKKEAKEWIATAQEIARKACGEQGWVKTEKTKIIMEITTYWKDKRRHDVHNGIKITADALEGILYDDDKWVLPRYIDFDVDKENPRLEIKIMKLNG